MIYYFLLMDVFSVLVMLGYKYRMAAIGYAVMWSGVYFMPKKHYNNHCYLMVLLTWIFKGTVLIVYFYSALAKMYPDWVDAVPIKICFSQKAGYPVIGLLLVQSWFQHVVALGGIIFDLLIGPVLLWKRTRKAALISSLVFHGFNSVVFQVGIFPFMGIAFGLFYFEPEVIQKLFFNQKGAFVARQEVVKAYFQTVKTVAFSGFIMIMLLLPLRHHLFEGNRTWTE